MTLKAYRTKRYDTDNKPRNTRTPATRSSGFFWGMSWQLEDDDAFETPHVRRTRGGSARR